MVRRSRSGPLMSGWGHLRLIDLPPEFAACPLRPRKRTSFQLIPAASSLRTLASRPRGSQRTRARLLARRTGRPGAASPIRRPWKRIGSAKAPEPPHLGQTHLLRGIAAVVADALPGKGRAPASAGLRRLAPLRARPAALGVSVGEQQSHYCDTEQNKTDRAHAVLPVNLFVRPIQKARVLASAPLPRRRTGLGTSRRLHPERCPLCSGSDAPPWRVLVPLQKRGLLTDTIPVFRSTGML